MTSIRIDVYDCFIVDDHAVVSIDGGEEETFKASSAQAALGFAMLSLSTRVDMEKGVKLDIVRHTDYNEWPKREED